MVTEQIHLRNYDGRRTHTVDITFRSDDEPVRETRYRIEPGRALSDLAAVPGGEYELQVTVDGERTESHRCHLGSAPRRTAVIEVGNGVVSVTDGLPV